MRKNNTAIILGGLFFSCSVMAGVGTLAPTVVPMVNGGQASIAISNTSPNLFTVPGDRITASILTLMSRPCGMTQKWWCWSWADWKTVRHCWLR